MNCEDCLNRIRLNRLDVCAAKHIACDTKTGPCTSYAPMNASVKDSKGQTVEEPLPCPCCGREASVYMGTLFRIKCDWCGIQTQPDTKNNVYAVWNRRKGH